MDLRGTILQPWNWHTPRVDDSGQKLWQRLERDARRYADLRFTALWLPPASKGIGGKGDVGYGVRDWYDLDDTRYGDGDELARACRALNAAGIQAYHDQVHNHLMGGDEEKGVWCLHVQKNNKNEPLDPSKRWFQADIPTGFPWLGLNRHHFDAYHPNDHDCWALADKRFDREAQADPLMGCDLDFDSVDLVMKLRQFGLDFKWQIPVDGYRFDAVKHVRPKGTLNFLTDMRRSARRNLFAVGEFFSENLGELTEYLDQTHHQIALFDFPLQRKLVHASREHARFDMRSLRHGTLTAERPVSSVSFVHSHDDQPPAHGEAHRGEYVGDWFISQAYAFVLLRDEGYPMVSDVDLIAHDAMLKRLVLARAHCSYGGRHDRFDHPNTVGWSFPGGPGYDNSMAVVMTNGTSGTKWLPTGRPRTSYRDLLDGHSHTITSNGDGWAEFSCPDRRASVWVETGKYFQLQHLAGAVA